MDDLLFSQFVTNLLKFGALGIQPSHQRPRADMQFCGNVAQGPKLPRIFRYQARYSFLSA